MTFRLSWRGPMAAAAALSVFAGGALAGTDTDQLTVTATVQSGCALAGGSLDFGQYVSGQPANLDVTGAINFVNCAAGNLTFALDGGGSGNVNSRQMTSGSNKLNYQIFRDPARTANWATGTNAKVTQLLTTQSGKVDVYGRIPGGQTAPAGTYTDTVTVTMTF